MRCSKTANVNVKKTYQFKTQGRCDDITALKQQTSLWVTLDVAIHGAAYERPMHSPILGYPKTFLLF